MNDSFVPQGLGECKQGEKKPGCRGFAETWDADTANHLHFSNMVTSGILSVQKEITGLHGFQQNTGFFKLSRTQVLFCAGGLMKNVKSNAIELNVF